MKNSSSSLISLRRGIRVLEFISLKPAGGTFGEIHAGFPDMTPATLTRLLKSMLDEGLLSKSADARNYQSGAEFENDAMRLLVKSEVADGFHYMDENRLNLHLSTHAFGITCLAFQPPETFRRLFELGKLHGMPRGQYLETFTKIRSEGVFINRADDRENLVRITAPVFYGESGGFAGAIGVSFYSMGKDAGRMKDLIGKVKDAAHKASSHIGSIKQQQRR
jgi:DNA-binding IclR family transcriptional regulator